MKYKCAKCGKEIDKSYSGGALYSLTEGYCKECADILNNKDLELLEAIKNGENLSRFLDD